MVIIKVPKEIRNYKEKVVGTLTLRNLLFSLMACAAGVYVYVNTRVQCGEDIAGWLCLFAGAPFLAFGYINPNGKPLEKYIIRVLKFYLNYEKVRIVKTNNFWSELVQEAADEEAELKNIRQKGASCII
jgi:hypothetical protein